MASHLLEGVEHDTKIYSSLQKIKTCNGIFQSCPGLYDCFCIKKSCAAANSHLFIAVPLHVLQQAELFNRNNNQYEKKRDIVSFTNMNQETDFGDYNFFLNRHVATGE